MKITAPSAAIYLLTTCMSCYMCAYYGQLIHIVMLICFRRC